MRITGGSLKGKILKAKFPDHVRPTTDFSRESLFNFLANHIELHDAAVLDLYSGSGIMALEFLSRGCAFVTSVDLDPDNHKIYKQIAQDWNLNKQWQPIKIPVEVFLRKPPNKLFQLAFADPPYHMPNIQNLPSAIFPLLEPNGWLVLEHKPGLIFPQKSIENRQYGSASFTIFAKP